MLKQSISLMITPVIIGLYVGVANANEVEVKTGNMRVSVQNGNVEVNSGSASNKVPSLLNRLSNLRLFGDRQVAPTRHPARSSNLKCDRRTSGHSSTRRNSSGTAVSQTRSSSTTMTCN
ncbi:MAG: hypothetical protein AAGE84_09340 [Cyanobacteria bacterium P01_G01_bin.39]